MDLKFLLVKCHYCTNCSVESRGTKDMVRRSIILEPPRNLIINIRRFKETESGVVKDTTKLQFPLRLWTDSFTAKKIPKSDEDLKAYYKDLTQEEADPENVYELYAVVTHKGTWDFGHYISFVSYGVGKDKKW